MDIAVIGAAGSVGRAVCMQLLATGILGHGEKLQLVGHRGGSSEIGVFGLRVDLLDAYGLNAPEIQTVLDGEKIDADIVIMIAGETASSDPSKPTTRDALAQANLPLFQHYADMLAAHNVEDQLVIVQSNPVELGVKVFADKLGRHRVVGAGSYNDSLRFRRELLQGLEQYAAHPSVMGHILGEHGTNTVPIWSSVKAAGIPQKVWQAHLEKNRNEATLPELIEHVGKARTTLAGLLAENKPQEASDFLDGLTADIRALVKPWFAHWSVRTSTATAHSVVDLVAELQAGHRTVLPLQVSLSEDEWPEGETVLGIPVDIDATGWHNVVDIKMTSAEHDALAQAGKAISQQLSSWV